MLWWYADGVIILLLGCLAIVCVWWGGNGLTLWGRRTSGPGTRGFLWGAARRYYDAREDNPGMQRARRGHRMLPLLYSFIAASPGTMFRSWGGGTPAKECTTGQRSADRPTRKHHAFRMSERRGLASQALTGFKHKTPLTPHTRTDPTKRNLPTRGHTIKKQAWKDACRACWYEAQRVTLGK